LEKSRVVFQQQNERNYHVFYQLVYGADDRMARMLFFSSFLLIEFNCDNLSEQYQLYSPENFHYMNQSGCYNVDGTDDVAEFKDVIKAMNTVGISQQEQDSIFAIVAGVLHIGNITFAEDRKGNAGMSDRNGLYYILVCN